MVFLQIFVVIGVAVGLLKLHQRVSWLKPIVMAYVLGVLVGNIFGSFIEMDVMHQLTGYSIIIALPIMLLPTNLKQWISQPKTMLLAYGLGALATLISVVIGYFIFRNSLREASLISGMIAGVYTGGTINLNAIGMAFDADESLSVLMNGFDMALSGMYLLLIFTLLPRILKFVLPWPSADVDPPVMATSTENSLVNGKKVLSSIGVGILIVGISAGIAMWVYGRLDQMFMIFGVSIFALLFSGVKKIQSNPAHMKVADFFMVIFGLTLGVQANVGELLNENSVILYFFLTSFLCMILLHLLFARIFKIDAITFLISSSAGVFGPPFIGPVAESLDAQKQIAPGVVVALIGNAIGTYVGIGLVKLLEMFGA